MSNEFLLHSQGYDISFLMTNFHTEKMNRAKLIDFVIQFMQEGFSFHRFIDLVRFPKNSVF